MFSVLFGYVFLTTHQIGETLLDPFEDIPTGVSLDQITRTIEIDLLELIAEKEIPSSVTPDGKDYVM